MSAVDQSLKKPFKTPWSPPASETRKKLNINTLCSQEIICGFRHKMKFRDSSLRVGSAKTYNSNITIIAVQIHRILENQHPYHVLHLFNTMTKQRQV